MTADLAILEGVFLPVEDRFALQDLFEPLTIKFAEIMTCRGLNEANAEINKVVPFLPGYCEAHFIHAINILHNKFLY